MKRENKIKKLSESPELVDYKTYINKIGEENPDTIPKAAAAEGRTKLALDSPDRGAFGESLAKDGLSQSGFAEYLKKSLADEVNADFSRALNLAAVKDHTSRENYNRYIASYNASQQKIRDGLVEKIVKGAIFDKDYAYRLALEAGLSEENAIFTASEAINKAKRKSIVDAIKFAKENDLYPNTAKNYALKLGLDERSADLVYNALSRNGYADMIDYDALGTDKYIEMLKKRTRQNN